MELRLTSPIPPSVNHYLAYRSVKRNGKNMAMSYKTREAVDYQKAFSKYVTEECDRQGWTDTPDPQQHFYVDTVFFFPQTGLDANNYFKVMLDAITDTGRVWVDDNTVCERVQAIYYTSEEPRIEITIKPVDYIGIFADRAHLDAFEDRCVDCKRYKRNCSILRRAKEGRIQSETDGETCSAYEEKRQPNKQKEFKEEENGEDKQSVGQRV